MDEKMRIMEGLTLDPATGDYKASEEIAQTWLLLPGLPEHSCRYQDSTGQWYVRKRCVDEELAWYEAISKTHMIQD